MKWHVKTHFGCLITSNSVLERQTATRGGLIPNFLANCYYKSEETLAIQNNVEV